MQHVNQLYIGSNMEVYIDDMLVNSLKSKSHIYNLQETFCCAKKVQYEAEFNEMCLMSNIRQSSLVGGIEVKPAKIVANINMQALKTIHDLQSLNARIAALSRFPSKFVERMISLFMTLRVHLKKMNASYGRRTPDIKYSEEAARPFEELEVYL